MEICDARRNCGATSSTVNSFVLTGPSLVSRVLGDHLTVCSSVKKAGTALKCRQELALTKKTPYLAAVFSRIRETVKQELFADWRNM